MPRGEDVQGRPKYASGETGTSCTGQVAGGVVSHNARLSENLLVLIITCQLGTINNTVTEAVSAPTRPQTFNALMLNSLHVAVERPIIKDFTAAFIIIKPSIFIETVTSIGNHGSIWAFSYSTY